MVVIEANDPIDFVVVTLRRVAACEADIGVACIESAASRPIR